MSRRIEIRETLQRVSDEAINRLEEAHAAREAGLSASRKAIQLSSRAIRAAHRGDFEEASDLSSQAGDALQSSYEKFEGQPQVRYSGFMLDGEKEFAESALTIALISGSALPSLTDLGVSVPAYLNGLAEAASELRRSALDSIRSGDTARADELLGYMDEAMAVLTGIDFPEGVTGGLRRTTDQLRAVTERTRGDVTSALRQAALEAQMRDLESKLDSK